LCPSNQHTETDCPGVGLLSTLKDNRIRESLEAVSLGKLIRSAIVRNLNQSDIKANIEQASTSSVYSFMYSLTDKQELFRIDALRQKCFSLRSTCLIPKGESTSKKAVRVVQLSPISTRKTA